MAGDGDHAQTDLVAELALQVTAAGADYCGADLSESGPDEAMLNVAIGVAQLLFTHADSIGAGPESVIQAFGYAVGERTRPQDASFHRHAAAVLEAGLRQGLIGDTIGDTEGQA